MTTYAPDTRVGTPSGQRGTVLSQSADEMFTWVLIDGVPTPATLETSVLRTVEIYKAAWWNVFPPPLCIRDADAYVGPFDLLTDANTDASFYDRISVLHVSADGVPEMLPKDWTG
jgi:hypothetical protein